MHIRSGRETGNFTLLLGGNLNFVKLWTLRQSSESLDGKTKVMVPAAE